jgi:hypothetical protein
MRCWMEWELFDELDDSGMERASAPLKFEGLRIHPRGKCNRKAEAQKA